MLWSTSYLILIHPVFLPSDHANPAVANFIASDTFQELNNRAFLKLDKYNKRQAGDNVDRPSEYIAVDPSQFGVTVIWRYKLVPQEVADIADKTSDLSATPRYKYVSEISVRPTLSVLILFLTFQLCWAIGIVFLFLRRKHPAQINFEERALNEYFSAGVPATSPSAESYLLGIEGILRNFHAFYTQLNHRHDDRPGIDIADEYDAQDILRALLRLHFRDVRIEEHTPSYAGAASRMDFLLHNEEIVVEVKMAREKLKDKAIGEQLIVDVARYSSHPRCKHLICFVYDPKYSVANPEGLRSDVMRLGGGKMKVDVIFSPAH
jgi:hypothetical protein